MSDGLKKKIAVGGIEHETAGFLPGETSLEDFLKSKISAHELKTISGESNTVIDGYISGIKHRGWDLAPLVWFKAQSGAPASKITFNLLLQELLENLKSQLPVDGILLSLHGSFAADGIDDADGRVLQEVREVVGESCPILAVHDLHCNVSQVSIDAADVILVMRTYPHIDMHARAEEAVSILDKIFDGAIKPTMVFRSLPILWSAPKMIDSEPPMRDAIRELEKIEQQTEVVSCSLGVGYQWIDSPVVGASAIVVTNDDPESAHQNANQLSEWIWEKRSQWTNPSLKPHEALKMGEEKGKYPIILADQADNTGGGAPGDSTEILRLFIQKGLKDAAVLYLVDPEAASAAHEIGEGGKLVQPVGGKSHPMCGPPINIDAEIVSLSDGRFVYEGPMWKGVEENLGLSALLKHQGVSIIIISKKQQPVDLAFSKILGLDCSKMNYLSLKSTGHFRSGFESIAGSIFNVDASGLFTQDFHSIPYECLGRPMYPLKTSPELFGI